MNSPRALMHACWIVPIIFGLYSLGQGADSNWDLRNYHLYNAYAFLHGRLAVDLAPAGMQSYFNPLLDVPYYLMTMHLPAMLVGFIMGVIHGLNFVLVLGICRLTLSDLPESLRYRLFRSSQPFSWSRPSRHRHQPGPPALRRSRCRCTYSATSRTRRTRAWSPRARRSGAAA